MVGRPKKSPEERHTETVRVPLRPADFARLQSFADQAKTSVTDFVRSSALGAEFTVIQSQTPDEDTIEQLRRIGVNLNQIAKALNAQRSIVPSELTSACDDLKTLLAQWMFHDPTHHHRAEL